MSNIFKTAIEGTFATWLASVGGGVDVVNGSESAKGIVKYDTAVDMGESLTRVRTGRVHVLTDDIGVIDVDGTVKVDGKRVFVTAVNIDAAGAKTIINFSESNPVTSVM
jgi:hypothetical protein